MDAIRKKMQSLKSETDGLYKTISGFEEATREAAARADQVSLLKTTVHLKTLDTNLKDVSTLKEKKKHFSFSFQADCDIRDYGKKVQQLEIGFDETNDKLNKSLESLEEKEKHFKEVESDVSALTRRLE